MAWYDEWDFIISTDPLLAKRPDAIQQMWVAMKWVSWPEDFLKPDWTTDCCLTKTYIKHKGEQ